MTQPRRFWRSLQFRVPALPTAPVAGMVLIPVAARREGAVDLDPLKAGFAGRVGGFDEAESDALQIEGRSDIA